MSATNWKNARCGDCDYWIKDMFFGEILDENDTTASCRQGPPIRMNRFNGVYWPRVENNRRACGQFIPKEQP